nr:hypothetical protein [Tanacetum cinerariifolium]
MPIVIVNVAQVSKCVAHTSLRQPAVTLMVVHERGKGLQRKEGSDYMELKATTDEVLLDTLLGCYSEGGGFCTGIDTITIIMASKWCTSNHFRFINLIFNSGILDHLLYVYMLRWKNTLVNLNDKAKKVTENTDNTPFEDSLGDVVELTLCVTPPKMRVAAEYCTEALLHNITATDT